MFIIITTRIENDHVSISSAVYSKETVVKDWEIDLPTEVGYIATKTKFYKNETHVTHIITTITKIS